MEFLCQQLSQNTLAVSCKGRVLERLIVEPSPWDTDVLQLKCGRIADFLPESGRDDFTHGEFYKFLPRELQKLELEYVVVRRPEGETSRILQLEAAGFAQLDRIVTFSRALLELNSFATPSGYAIRESHSADVDPVVSLSGASFNLSRFHVDPLLTEDQAIRIHRQWAKDSLAGLSAKIVFVAESKNAIGGFITCKLDRENSGVIDLIATAPNHAGKGLGKALVSTALNWFKTVGCHRSVVQTQVNNSAAIKLYTGLGFVETKKTITARWSSLQV